MVDSRRRLSLRRHYGGMVARIEVVMPCAVCGKEVRGSGNEMYSARKRGRAYCSAEHSKQRRINARSRMIEYRGVTQTATQWAEELGLSPVIVLDRARKGWTSEMILERPVVPPRLRHGYARKGQVHPVHSIWRDMIQRCTNPKSLRYETYGARGIGVVKSWLTFENFVRDMGPRPPGVGKGGRSLYSLDRINNDKNYGPKNCKWSTSREQGERTTRSRLLTYKGETMILSRWAERIGISRVALHARIMVCGWSVERALSTPLREW